MFARNLIFACAFLVGLADAAYPKSALDTTAIALTVESGFPLQVTLTEALHFKENESVYARVVEPVYSFDREVIPAGTRVEGTITGFQKIGKWKRVSSVLSGDFTPLREPLITFHTLVFHNGTRIPIETVVAPGSEKTVGLDRDRAAKDSGNSHTSTKKEGAGSRVKKLMWGMSPYHPQSLAPGAPFYAVLTQPLDFGVASFVEGALDAVGSQPPAQSIVSARLITPLDSGTALPGAPVEALLTRPLFSSDHRLLFPVGSKLRGEVIGVKRARSFHRNGQLAFRFTTLEALDFATPGEMPVQEVDGSLYSAQVTHELKDIRFRKNEARIVESKKRFIGPAWAFIKFDRELSATADSFDDALLGAYRSKFLKQAIGQKSSFGLPGSLAGAMVPPVAIGLGIFGAGRSVYSNFLGRGRNVTLPANTWIQIRLTNDVPEEATVPEKENHLP